MISMGNKRDQANTANCVSGNGIERLLLLLHSTTTKIVLLTSPGFFSCNPKVLARAIIIFFVLLRGGENQIDWRSIPCLIKFLFIFLIKQINKGMSIGQWSSVGGYKKGAASFVASVVH